MPGRNFADDYVMVNERIVAFKEKYPDGSLQSEIVDLTDGHVVMRGVAYRTPDDERPGIGHSAMSIPGKTPFTRDSEIENCETSAWGRALAALGFEVKRGIATMEEVAMKRGDEEAVEIEPSELSGLQRGGRTNEANKLQIRQAQKLSQQLGLGTTGFAEAIKEFLNQEILLSGETEYDSGALNTFLKDLSRDDIQTLIQGLSQRVRESDEPAEE